MQVIDIKELEKDIKDFCSTLINFRYNRTYNTIIVVDTLNKSWRGACAFRQNFTKSRRKASCFSYGDIRRKENFQLINA